MITFLDDPFITYNNHEITVGLIASRSSFLIFQNNYIGNPQDGVAPGTLVDSVTDIPNSFPLGICRCLNEKDENQAKCYHKQSGLSLFDILNKNNHLSLQERRETQNHNNIRTSTRSGPVIKNCHNPSHQNNNNYQDKIQSSYNILGINIMIGFDNEEKENQDTNNCKYDPNVNFSSSSNSVTMLSPRIYISDDPWETQFTDNHDNGIHNNLDDGRYLTELFETATNERVVIPSNSYSYESDINTNTNSVLMNFPRIYISDLWETQPPYNYHNDTDEVGRFSTEVSNTATNERVVIPSDPWAMDKLGTVNISAANDETGPTIVERYDVSDKQKESSLLIFDSDTNTNTNITEVDCSGFDDMWMEEKLNYCDNSEEKSTIKDCYGDTIYNDYDEDDDDDDDDEDDDGDDDGDEDDDDFDDGNYSFATPPEATFETFDTISLLTYGSFIEDEMSTTSEDKHENSYIIEIMDDLSVMKEKDNFLVVQRFPVGKDVEMCLDQKMQDLNDVDITFLVSSKQKDEKEDDDDDENGNKFGRFLTPLFLDRVL